jgi:hypothetical protein
MATTDSNQFPRSVRSEINQAFGSLPPVPIVVCGTDRVRMNVFAPPVLIEAHREPFRKILEYFGTQGFQNTQFAAELDVGQRLHRILSHLVLLGDPGAQSVPLKVKPRTERDVATGGAWLCSALVDATGKHTDHKEFFIEAGPNPTESEPRGDWKSADKVFKICVRSGVQVTVNGTTHPKAGPNPEEIFNKRFHELFSGTGHHVTFAGIKAATANENPVRMTAGYQGASTGISRSSTTERNRNELSQMGARYALVAEAYGMAEGGWDALNTYDGPKLSFGWAQLTFGPNPSAASTPAGGWGKNFMAFLYSEYPLTFDDLFGKYGFRITWSTAPATRSAGYAISGTASDNIQFWRLPCHYESALPTPIPTANDVFTPPAAWVVQRKHTASVGFVALMVQAFRDGGFNGAMRRFIEGMIDSAASGGQNLTIRQVARRMRDNVIRPGASYTIHADKAANTSDPRWEQPF